MIEVYYDGASAGNPGPSGAGVFVIANGEVERISVPLPVMTNHEAEFHAFIEALKICRDRGHKMVSFRTDSEMVNRAVEKEFAKNQAYAPLLREVLTLMKTFELCFLKWVPSKENKTADELARIAIRQAREGRGSQ
jgi:ribonuclease HI